MIKKIFFFIILFTQCSYSEINFKIIATVNSQSITKFDLQNEIKILEILNKKKINYQAHSEIALENLINEKIKIQEIDNKKISIDEKIINNYYNILKNNLNLDQKKIDSKLLRLLKKKIKIENEWNKLIVQNYSWKISVNIEEIEKKISVNNGANVEDILKMKEKIITEEKNKKLLVFSKYHLNKLKSQALIKFYK